MFQLSPGSGVSELKVAIAQLMEERDLLLDDLVDAGWIESRSDASRRPGGHIWTDMDNLRVELTQEVRRLTALSACAELASDSDDDDKLDHQELGAEEEETEHSLERAEDGDAMMEDLLVEDGVRAGLGIDESMDVDVSETAELDNCGELSPQQGQKSILTPPKRKRWEVEDVAEPESAHHPKRVLPKGRKLGSSFAFTVPL